MLARALGNSMTRGTQGNEVQSQQHGAAKCQGDSGVQPACQHWPLGAPEPCCRGHGWEPTRGGACCEMTLCGLSSGGHGLGTGGEAGES